MDLKDDLESQKGGLKKSIRNFLRLAWACIALAVLLFVFYALCPFYIYKLFPFNTHDYAIAIPVLLASIAGVFFVYIAFLGQRWQMLYQQQEIRDNRQEMKNSTTELKNQAEALTNQISRMDRDFVHQNFFRILEQHYKTRDRINNPILSKPDKVIKIEYFFKYPNDNSFFSLFDSMLNWVDNEFGWEIQMNNEMLKNFERYKGFKFVEKGTKDKISDLPKLKLKSSFNGYYGLNYEQIQFIFRFFLQIGFFNSYIRSTFYLLDYVKENNLTNYYKAIESGMGNEERIFMFYFLTTQFDLYNESDLKDWLMENNFLYSIKENELLDMEHKILLYPKEGDLPIPHMK